MPPLTRQHTLESLRSWWSDSNPNLRGPTVNLHAAAKPLIRFLHDRQALEFIKNNRGIALTVVAFELYLSYLSCEYVSASTKSAILEDLLRRARCDEDTLEVHSNILQLLGVPATTDTRMMKAIRLILRAWAKCAKATCGSLVDILCDSRVLQVVEEVLAVLSDVSPMKFLPVISGASMEAKLLHRLSDMPQDSSSAQSHRWRILQNLARYESTTVAIVEADILNFVDKLLGSCPTNLYRHIFPMLRGLASYESTAMAVVRVIPFDLLGPLWRKSVDHTAPVDMLATWWEDLVTAKLLDSPRKAIVESTCGSLVALVCDSNVPQVVDGALWVLSRIPHIKFPPVTAGVSVQAKLLDHIVAVLKAPNTAEWRYPVIFQILFHLALHDESSEVAVVEENRFTNSSSENVDSTTLIDPFASWLEVLVTTKLLGAPRKAMAEAACGSLVALVWSLMEHYGYYLAVPISNSRQSQPEYLALHEPNAVAVVEANVLTSVEKLLRSNSIDLYQHIFPMLVILASHECTATAVLGMRLYDLLVTLWRLLRELVGHESTVQAVVAIVSRKDIVALLSAGCNDIFKSVVKTLKILDATLERIDTREKESENQSFFFGSTIPVFQIKLSMPDRQQYWLRATKIVILHYLASLVPKIAGANTVSTVNRSSEDG
ncbi:hypothetical protein C8J57DRAFT_1613773 [Mycena rebaudengoi]|nr:hypothetical protein C8J57DRAFT_1613773 [Mycena rebaudengoi]